MRSRVAQAAPPLARAALAISVLLAPARPSQAEPPDVPGAAEGERIERIARAKRLFEHGNALRRAGDCERAAAFFAQSRALVPSVANTLNAAVCLASLGRHDEALELHELLLTELSPSLRDDERAFIAPESARLRALLGALDVFAGAGAELWIDGRPRGTLPLAAPLRLLPGRRDVRIVASGRKPFAAEVEVVVGQTAVVRAELEPLPEPKREARPVPPARTADDERIVTPREPAGRLGVEVLGGVSFAPRLGSGAEQSCAVRPCSRDSAASGILVGARLSYELPSRIALELTGGYLALSKRVARRMVDSFESQDGATVPTRYDLEDELDLAGALLGFGLGYRLPLAGPVELGAHLVAGPHFTVARHTVTGSASASGPSTELSVAGSGARASAVNLFVAPSIELGVRFGRFGVRAGVLAAFMLLDGPAPSLGDAHPKARCEPSVDPRAIGCAPGVALTRDERAYGPFALIAPVMSAGYLF